MKVLSDFLPVFLFFVVYFVASKVDSKENAIYWATGTAVVVSVIFAAITYITRRKIEKMQLVSAGLITVLGTLTIVFKNPVFTYWKPTLVNWAFAAAFLGSLFIGEKPLIQHMLQKAMKPDTPAIVYRRLTYAWAGFFTFTGFLNWFVFHLVEKGTIAESTWVNFKLFGLMGLMFVFVIAQGFFIRHHLQEPEKPDPEKNDPEKNDPDNLDAPSSPREESSK